MNERSAYDGAIQLAGNLPPGANEDSWLTPRQFWTWQRRSRSWFAQNKDRLPGVVSRGRKDCAVHVGAFLNGTFRRPR